MINQDKLGPWLVTIAALLWAVDAPFRKYLTGGLSSTTIVLMEHLVIAVLVLVFLWRYLPELKRLVSCFIYWLWRQCFSYGIFYPKFPLCKSQRFHTPPKSPTPVCDFACSDCA